MGGEVNGSDHQEKDMRFSSPGLGNLLEVYVPASTAI